jgi:NADP-dependent 3-hydroxy acid dehydrogenase YdfG/Tfp pilus assembly protein PilF
MNKLILTYCIENQYVAAKIISAIKGKMEVEKVVFDASTGIEALKKAANGNAFPVLILISDNFLKSEMCMNESLPYIQSLGASQRLIPVTCEGVYPTNNGGQMTTVSTSFDRVSNVIQYMNHWQDRYLELRKLKIDGDETAHNEKVRVVRAISSEIGELLRYFRTMAFYNYDQFKESNFIILYRVLGLSVTKEMEEAKNMAVSHTVLPTERVENAYSYGAKTPVESIVIEPKTPIVSAEIPGMAQLAERFNVRDASVGGATDAVVAKVEEVKAYIPSVALPIENVVKEETKVLEVPTTAPKNDMPFTLESMIQDIRAEDKPAVAGFSLEQIAKDEELSEIMKKQTFTESVETIFEKVDTSSTPFTKVAEQEALLNADEHNLVKQIAAESAAEKPIAPMEIVEHFREKTDAELSEEIVDEEAIQQEVARVFDEAEQADPNFDFESEIAQSIENQKETVEHLPLVAPHLEGAVHTEGVIDLAKLSDDLKANPSNNSLRYKYAAELTNQNRYAEATEQLDILLDNDRKNVDAYVLLAYLAEQQGDFILSLNSLEKVTLLKPDYPGIYYKLGRLTNEHFKKQNRKALHYFKDAVAQDPTNADAQYRYGLALIEQNGDFKTAIDHLNIAAEQAPQHDVAIFELSKAYFETNDKANAAKWYARATELNPAFKTESNDQLFTYEEPKLEPIPEPEPESAVIDNGMTVLITGATSGIGKATAAVFAKNGYRLILTGRRADRLDALKTEFEETFKNRNQLLNFDVRSLDDVKKALTELEEDFKNVDILINNAGLASGLAPIHEGDIEDWDKMIDTNIKGLLYMTRAIAPKMVARRKGHIINIGSIAGKEIYPNGNVYCASKFAVDALTRAMRVDLHKYNIRVSQVTPGAVEETEFALVRFHGDADKASIYKDFTPLKAADIAETIYFMATRPEYVNIQDVVMMGTQQASANHFDRSGRTDIKE